MNTGPFTLALIAAVVLARALDFISTWLVTPRLALEANPLARRLRMGRMIALNAPLAALPLFHHGLAITLVVLSALVAGTNLSSGALARGQGEAAQLESQRRALRRIGLPGALAMNSAGALVVCAGGGFMMALAPAPESHPWWAALGVVAFGGTALVHFNLAIVRLWRTGRGT